MCSSIYKCNEGLLKAKPFNFEDYDSEEKLKSHCRNGSFVEVKCPTQMMLDGKFRLKISSAPYFMY